MSEGTNNEHNDFISVSNDSQQCDIANEMEGISHEESAMRLQNNSDFSVSSPEINSESKETEDTLQNSESDVPDPSLNFENMKSSENFENEKEDDDWLDIMGSGNFKKKIIKKGLGHDTRPDRGDIITASITFSVNGVTFEDQNDFKFIVGDLDVIQGVDLVVCLMEKGERAQVIIPSKLAYGKLGRLPDVPPDSDIEGEIEIKEIVPFSEANLSVQELLNLGNLKRERGNFFYERSDYLDAIHCYERGSEYLDGIRDCSGSSTEESQEILDTKIKVYNNLAVSHLKLHSYDSALMAVENVLKVQPQNIKALFRKAKILSAKGNTDEAMAAIKLAIQLEPDEKLFQAELMKLQYKKKKEEENQRIMYQRMFPRSEPKRTRSYSKAIKWGAATFGVAALAIGLAVYKQFNVL